MADIAGGSIIWNLDIEDSKFIEKLNKAKDSVSKASSSVEKSFSSASEKIGKNLENIGDNLTSVGSSLIKLGAAPTLALVGITKAAINFEDSFTGVRKTVDLSDEGFKELASNLRNMAKEIPVNVNELNNIAQVAGQLGIAGVQNISKFAETISKFTIATGIAGETAATEFARIANVMQEPIENIDRMGSVVAMLGDAGAATEIEILNFAERIAGAGKIAGLSTDQVFAIGSAFSSVGIEAEAGGTAVQKVLISMYQAATGSTSSIIDNSEAIGKNTKKLKELRDQLKKAELRQDDFTDKTKESSKVIAQMNIDKYSKDISSLESELRALNATHGKATVSSSSFAKVLGVTNEQFKEMFKNNPQEVFSSFVTELGKMSAEGKNAAGVLEDLELGDQRLIRSFLSLSNAGDLLNEQFRIANKEWGDNSRLNEEFARRVETASAQWQLFKNKVEDVAITLGSVLLPRINDILQQGLGPLANKFADFAEKHPQFISALLLIGGAFTVMGTLILGAGALIGAAGKIASSGWSKFFIAMELIAVAVAALVFVWETNMFGIQEKTQALVDWFQNTAWPAIERVFGFIKGVVTEFTDYFEVVFGPIVREIIEGIQGKFTEWHTNLVKIKDEIIAAYDIFSSWFKDTFGKSIGDTIRDILIYWADQWASKWTGNIKTIIDVVGFLIDKFVDLIKKMGEVKQGLKDMGPLGEAILKTGGSLLNPFPGFAGGVTNFSGGMALVGEQGPELVDLPRGSNVYPAKQTSKMMNSGGGATIHINEMVVRDDHDIDRFGEQIGFLVGIDPGIFEG